MPTKQTVLAPGIYWLDAFSEKTFLIGPDRSAEFRFDQWLKDSKGLVKVLRVVPHLDERPRARQWFLFEVLFPAVWDDKLGVANVAPKGKATEEEDTVSRPDLPPGLPSGLFDAFDLRTAFSGGSGILLLALAYFALSDRR